MWDAWEGYRDQRGFQRVSSESFVDGLNKRKHFHFCFSLGRREVLQHGGQHAPKPLPFRLYTVLYTKSRKTSLRTSHLLYPVCLLSL